MFLLPIILKEKAEAWRHDRRKLHEKAKQARVFEQLQAILDEHDAGRVDVDINHRLRQRYKLLCRSRLSEEKTPAKKSSVELLDFMKALLHTNLSLERTTAPSEEARPSLKASAERTALHLLADSICEGRRTSLFAGGGELELPVRVWWKTAASEGRLSFPLGDAGEHAEIQNLVKACTPATFGRGQEDVLDDQYRRAGKLDLAEFLTDFCPYKTGIIDQITKLLCATEREGWIRCELYKLNVSI